MWRSRLRKIAIASAVGGAIYKIDKDYNASVLKRNVKTVYNGAIIAVDYKFNFRPDNAASIENIHERVAKRLFEVCRDNGGIYIKMGQAIASQSAILPAPYQKYFSSLFDNAPAVSYDQVVRVVTEDLGRHPDEIFAEFSHEPVASASIAQVHKAKLKDGTVVAVKIQKPAIQKQMEYDLLAYRALVLLYENIFDLPMYWTCQTVIEHIRQEVDFENEARNSEKAWNFLKQEPTLQGRVYVPKIYWENTSKRVMVAEWVTGVKLTDRKSWEKWGFRDTEVMQTTIDMFASQIFSSGFVHADPHPGNVLVRPSPTDPRRPQVVLIDHGLYMEESEKFRAQYCELWKSIFLMDLTSIEKICTEWGMNDPDMMAMITLQRPYQIKKNKSKKDLYAAQLDIKERLKKFLSDQDKIPRELIFLGRNMELVRGNNKMMGSPVNRINIMARWAARNLEVDTNRARNSVLNIVKGQWGSFRFEMSMMVLNFGFTIQKWYDNLHRYFMGGEVHGFEDILEAQMRSVMKDQLGLNMERVHFDA